jgi:uncharacterized protein YggL (DUF469 family)
MKKRLRKKLRLGEFVELVFVASVTWHEGTSPDCIERTNRDLVACLTSMGLSGRIGAGDEIINTMISRRGGCTELDQERVFDWLVENVDCDEILITRLYDNDCDDEEYSSLFRSPVHIAGPCRRGGWA